MPGDPETSQRAPATASDPRARARQAILATCLVYGGYTVLGFVPVLRDLRQLALIAAFYFLPGVLLRREPAVAERYQVGPDSPIPRWSWRGLKVAAIACAVLFPPFVLGFFWFYGQVCAGHLDVVAPVVWLEGWTPLAGGLEEYLARLCRPHAGALLPEVLRLPLAWREWGGLGFLSEVAIGLFTVALAEEVFHRGYLMSALEERWPPRRTILGVPFGLAAVLSSLLFAVGHLVSMVQIGRLATFFPSLVFAWLWRRSGSLWAPALFHLAANLLMDALLATTFPR
ncbi:MAG: CPBP family intramembrane metalloprotease [Myxococcales bacterium]|nr:CPBP family intramembrane metalloprotease [Myxococcales bacterium]